MGTAKKGKSGGGGIVLFATLALLALVIFLDRNASKNSADVQSLASPNTPAPAVAQSPKAVAKTATTTSPAAKPAAPVCKTRRSAAQMANVRVIVQVGQRLGMPRRAWEIAVMTAMQESDLYNRASSSVPSSFNYPHQGHSEDHDSVGLFQQRAGWGTVKERMDPIIAARKFYVSLRRVSGWQVMSRNDAAQAVQISGYPYAYAKHQQEAINLVACVA